MEIEGIVLSIKTATNKLFETAGDFIFKKWTQMFNFNRLELRVTPHVFTLSYCGQIILRNGGISRPFNCYLRQLVFLLSFLQERKVQVDEPTAIAQLENSVRAEIVELIKTMCKWLIGNMLFFTHNYSYHLHSLYSRTLEGPCRLVHKDCKIMV